MVTDLVLAVMPEITCLWYHCPKSI